MLSIHMVTGGTGFIGSAVILELLQQTDVEVVCLVRTGNQPVEERLHLALEAAGRAYGYEDYFLQAAKKRCHAIPGNVSVPSCGITGTFPERVEQFWHCAASLQYEDRYKEEIYATNLEGTRHALALARSLHISDHFNYISTAYVAGRRTGLIREQIMPTNDTNNHYEASKVEAEAAVMSERAFPTRILRPGVVMGHSRTYAVANSFTGVYGFMRKLLQFKGVMSRVQEGLLSREALRICADPDAPMNLVPIDLVARQAVQIACSASTEKVFHLTGVNPPTISEILFLLFEEVGLKQPELSESRAYFSWIDKKFDQGITFYSSYLVSPKTFDRTHTDAVVGKRWADAGDFLINREALLAYFRWYLDLLVATRPRLLATR
jgi:nucleoside-diphosphate-sugar epimerase